MTAFSQRALSKFRTRLASRRTRGADAGDTLIELLIALAVLGIVLVAVLSGFMTAMSTSLLYRSSATMDTVLRTAAEEVTSQWQQNSAIAFTCPNNTPATTWTTGNAPYIAKFSSEIPAGYSAQVVKVNYWNGGGFNAGCAALQPQQITVQVSYGGLQHTIGFVVQDPAAPVHAAAGAPTQLVFLPGGGPSDSTSGFPISNQPQVAIEDKAGNIVTNDVSPITLSISSGPSGATLSNCQGHELYGAVSFSGCEIDQVGTYTLAASNGTLTSSPSASFAVTAGPPAQLIFTASPGNTVAGKALSSQPVITIEDAVGNPVTTDSSQVALSITAGTGSPGATLTNCSQSEAQGVVSFSGCEINQAANHYTLTATDNSITIISSSFNVTPGSATHLGFTTSPGNSAAGALLAPQPVVTVLDAFNNPVTADSSNVTLTIKAGTGTSGAVLSGCSQSESQGVVSFSGCKINKLGNGYILTATDGSLTSVTSAAFNITAGPPAQLIFTASPGNTVAGKALSSQPVITIEDAVGNPVTTDSSQVALSITAGTGSPGATLTNCSQSEAQGVVSFSGCEINQAANHYTLTATDNSITIISSSFNVTPGSATHLGFTTSPGNSAAGALLAPQPVVTVLDAFNNPVTADSSNVTLTIKAGTGTSGAVLSGCSQSESQGVVSFSGCKINKLGNGYILTATDGSLTSVTSAAFNIVVGPPAQLIFTASPGNTSTAGNPLIPQPKLTVEDANGNIVTSDNSQVNVSITPGTGSRSAKLSGCSQSESQGVVSFSGCTISRTSTGYSLTATDGTLTSVSSSFNVG